MERQRRIGLKNLFEELKRQIPSISDEERAPKVHILRETADLCRKLNKDQEEMKALKMQCNNNHSRSIESVNSDLMNCPQKMCKFHHDIIITNVRNGEMIRLYEIIKESIKIANKNAGTEENCSVCKRNGNFKIRYDMKDFGSNIL